MPTLAGGFGTPGFSDIRETAESNFLWGMTGIGQKPVVYRQALVIGATRDAGNSGSTAVLRPGLLLAKKSDGTYTNYDPTSATAEIRMASAILPIEIRATDFNGVNADRYLPVVVSGNVIASKIWGLDRMARSQLARQFLFDDDYNIPPMPFENEIAKTADYTLVAADNGRLFTNTGAAGAVVFTLPAIAPGLIFSFLGIANQNITITSAEGTNIVALNNAGATSVAFSTSGNKIGAHCTVFSNQAGTKWITRFHSAATATLA